MKYTQSCRFFFVAVAKNWELQWAADEFEIKTNAGYDFREPFYVQEFEIRQNLLSFRTCINCFAYVLYAQRVSVDIRDSSS